MLHPLPGPSARELSSRRRRPFVSGGALIVAVLALAGCTTAGEPEPAAVPAADELAVTRAAGDATRLCTGALAVAAATPEHAADLRRIAADHTGELAALGTAAAGPSPSATPDVTTLSRQLTAEWNAARTALRDGLAADDAGLAVLLVRIAATRAAHADRLAELADRDELPALSPAPRPEPSATATPDGAPTSSDPVGATPDVTPSASGTGPGPPPTASPTAPDGPQQEAFDRLLAGQHAAVYAYPLAIPRLAGADRQRARELWSQHQADRNALTARLLEAGVEPTAAEPAYDAGTVSDAPGARRLLGRVENGVAGLAAGALATVDATDAGDRQFAAGQLVLATRDAAGWTGRPASLPGAAATPSPASTGP